VSDHLCWGRHGGFYAHDLLPLPFTEEALALVIERVLCVQDVLQRQIMLENVSSYMTFPESTMPEWVFLSRIAEQADCGILFDINNIYVSARNNGFDPRQYQVPVDRVGQFHLAGHTNNGTHIVDTHDHPIIGGVWDLYAEAVRLFPGTPTMIERDANIPTYAELLVELDMARGIAERVARESARAAAE
jgi:uncharacterized protein (UPF0276 family)